MKLFSVVRVALALIFLLGLFGYGYTVDNCVALLEWQKPSYYATLDNCAATELPIPADSPITYDLFWRLKPTDQWVLLTIPPTANKKVQHMVPNLPCNTTIQYKIGSRWEGHEILCYTEIHTAKTVVKPAGCNQ